VLEQYKHILEVLLAGALAVIGYFLRRKDVEQEHQIMDLYTKHTDDANRLQALELKVVGTHYNKRETDQHINQVQFAIDHRLDRIEKRLDGFERIEVVLARLERTLDSTLK
jgi:predicted membrane chloride channel (bestrophin family)